MANQLAMDKVQAIKSLEAAGLSERQIAATLSVSRKAVRRHLGRGSSKDTKAPTGSPPVENALPTSLDNPATVASRSLCERYREILLDKLEQGLTAQRIFQDLRDEHGFAGKYHSVRRYVRRLSERSELAFRRIEAEPGHEMQVDYGTLSVQFVEGLLVSDRRWLICFTHSEAVLPCR